MEVIHLIMGKSCMDGHEGIIRIVPEMAANQVYYGYPVQVWGISKTTSLDYRKKSFKTALYKKYRNTFRADPQLLSDLHRKKDSIVIHMHGTFTPVFYTISKFLQDHHIPYIITPYSNYNKVSMNKSALLKIIYFNLFEKSLLKHAKSIHLLEKTEWEELNILYHNNKSKLIPYLTLPASIRRTSDLDELQELPPIEWSKKHDIYDWDRILTHFNKVYLKAYTKKYSITDVLRSYQYGKISSENSHHD